MEVIITAACFSAFGYYTYLMYKLNESRRK